MNHRRRLSITILVAVMCLGWRNKTEYPCGEHIDYTISDAQQRPADGTTDSVERVERPDIEAGTVEIDGETLVIRYVGPEGQEIVLTYEQMAEVPDTDSG